MKSLSEIYQNHLGPDGWGDKGTAHTYIEEYERLLEPYRHNSTVLEIGIAYGHSMEMWCDYFINSRIIGVDITNHGIPEETRYKAIFCDASSPEIIPYIKDYELDVVIDDGSHNSQDQINSFNLLKDYMSPNGLYIIEDINNIDHIQSYFETVKDKYSVEIIDNRHKKNRNDDVLILIKNF